MVATPARIKIESPFSYPQHSTVVPNPKNSYPEGVRFHPMHRQKKSRTLLGCGSRNSLGTIYFNENVTLIEGMVAVRSTMVAT
jgi:hypothetical protein